MVPMWAWFQKTNTALKWSIEKIFHENRNEKKPGVAIFISEKKTLKQKPIRDKEGHYIIINGSIQQDNVAFVNISAVLLPHLNILHNVLKQKETKRRKSTVIYWIEEQIILQTRLFLLL